MGIAATLIDKFVGPLSCWNPEANSGGRSLQVLLRSRAIEKASVASFLNGKTNSVQVLNTHCSGLKHLSGKAVSSLLFGYLLTEKLLFEHAISTNFASGSFLVRVGTS